MSGGFREADRIDFTPDDIARCVEVIRGRTPAVPRVALILGSGLGGFADSLVSPVSVDYHELPGFPVATVEGHAGRLVVGQTGGVPVVAQQGRFHLYEGYSAAQVTFPLRVMHALGARVLVVTNAAGGVDPRLNPGDLMLIEDQVNFQFRSPLRGRGPLVDADRFVDMAEPFSKRLLAIGFEVAAERGLCGLRAGTYSGNSGPPMRHGPRSPWRAAGWRCGGHVHRARSHRGEAPRHGGAGGHLHLQPGRRPLAGTPFPRRGYGGDLALARDLHAVHRGAHPPNLSALRGHSRPSPREQTGSGVPEGLESHMRKCRYSLRLNAHLSRNCH